MTRYKNLFIDLDDTLWAFSENAYDAFREVYDHYDFYRYFDSFDYFFDTYTERNKVLWKIYGDGKISKEQLNYERFSYPLLQVGIVNDRLVRDYMCSYFEIIQTKDKLMPHAREVLDYLYGRYKLYILSNGFRELQFTKLERAKLNCYFTQVILSDDLKINKPHPEIFCYAMSITHSVAEESLMIGDNFDTDIVGAAHAGMDQVFYNHQRRNSLPFRPTYEIFSLTELFDLL